MRIKILPLVIIFSNVPVPKFGFRIHKAVSALLQQYGMEIFVLSTLVIMEESGIINLKHVNVLEIKYG